MDCSICMEAIQGDSNISKTECGHSFHFQCLYRWNRKHTNCPMCRKEFGGIEEQEEQPAWDSYEYIFNFATQRHLTVDTSFRRNLRDEVARINEQVPIEEFTGEIEERDIQLVMSQVPGVSRETAEAYLRYYDGDLVDTILYLTDHKDMPIPRFRRRDRPVLPEPYVSRLVSTRLAVSMREEAESGYESV